MPAEDWTVNVLMDTGSVRAQARTALAAVFLILCIAALAVAVLMQRRMRLNERMRCRPKRATNWSGASRSARPILPASTAASRRRSPSGG